MKTLFAVLLGTSIAYQSNKFRADESFGHLLEPGIKYWVDQWEDRSNTMVSSLIGKLDEISTEN